MYISEAQKKKVEESGANIAEFQDLVYAITTFILKMWNSDPSDKTINVITKELVTDPKNSKFVKDLRVLLADSLTVADVYTACRLAYDEFFQRIVRLHRAVQCRENGDIEGYQLAMKPLLDKLGSEIKKEMSSQLILPGK